MLYEAYLRVLLGLFRVAVQEMQQPLQVLYQLYLGIFVCLRTILNSFWIEYWNILN